MSKSESHNVQDVEELLAQMEEYAPTVGLFDIHSTELVWTQAAQIPDELTTFYLQKSGFHCPDARV